jgi:hypothetical protein
MFDERIGHQQFIHTMRSLFGHTDRSETNERVRNLTILRKPQRDTSALTRTDSG